MSGLSLSFASTHSAPRKRGVAANRDGNAGQPSQVSWFLDQFLPNVGPQSDMQDVCGLELITSWEARFSEIYMPGLRETFDVETTTQLTNLLEEFPLSSVPDLPPRYQDAR